MRLFDFNLVPTEFLDKERIDNTVYFFLRYLLSKKPYEIKKPLQERLQTINSISGADEFARRLPECERAILDSDI